MPAQLSKQSGQPRSAPVFDVVDGVSCSDQSSVEISSARDAHAPTVRKEQTSGQRKGRWEPLLRARCSEWCRGRGEMRRGSRMQRVGWARRFDRSQRK